MKKEEVLAVIEGVGILPAIRVASADDAHFAVEAVSSGGIPIVEITLTVPGAVELIAHLKKCLPKIVVGAGTILDAETARKCVEAGAGFLTSPGFYPAITEFAAKHGIASLPGALTPTEVANAWQSGGDMVKVFPCAQVGGEVYIRTLKRCFPQIPLIAAGGVTQQTAEGLILGGAAAIGVGTSLIPSEAIASRQRNRIRELARRFNKAVKDARARLEPERPIEGAAELAPHGLLAKK